MQSQSEMSPFVKPGRPSSLHVPTVLPVKVLGLCRGGMGLRPNLIGANGGREQT